MEIVGTVFLALVQGITEFLPISSSGHLILGRWLLEMVGISTGAMTPAEELALDVALHVGSLGAVVIYFWRDIRMLFLGLIDGLTGKGGARFHLMLKIIVASLPIVVIAFIVKDFVTDFGRNVPIIAATTLVFGALLWVADRQTERKGEIETMSWRDAMIVGLAQCLALVPGVSRSGICMTAGRMVGLDRPLSARLAMLLSIPTILGAGTLATYDLYKSGNASLTTEAIFGGAIAFVSALIAIALLMRWLERQTYTPFVIYRLVLGIVLFGLIALGLA